MSGMWVNILARVIFGVIFGITSLSVINYFEINSNAAIMVIGYWCFSLAEGISDTISDRKTREKSDE